MERKKREREKRIVIELQSLNPKTDRLGKKWPLDQFSLPGGNQHQQKGTVKGDKLPSAWFAPLTSKTDAADRRHALAFPTMQGSRAVSKFQKSGATQVQKFGFGPIWTHLQRQKKNLTCCHEHKDCLFLDGCEQLRTVVLSATTTTIPSTMRSPVRSFAAVWRAFQTCSHCGYCTKIHLQSQRNGEKARQATHWAIDQTTTRRT